MSDFIFFALYLCFGVSTLVIVPVMMVPGLALKRKLLISALSFLLLVPGGLIIYDYVGAPQMAVSR